MKLNKLVPYVGLFASLFLVNCDDSAEELVAEIEEQVEEVVEEQVEQVEEVVEEQVEEVVEEVVEEQVEEVVEEVVEEMPTVDATITLDDPAVDVLGNSFSFGDIASINVVANPVAGGTNPDVTNVFEAIVDTNLGNGFNGFGFGLEDAGLEVLDFTGDNKIITVSVYSEVAFNLQLQIGNGRDEAGVDIIDPRPANTTAAHTGSGWEDLTFDFSMSPLFNPFGNNPERPTDGAEIPAEELGDITGTYNAIQFQFNGAPAAAETVFYIDNIIYNQ